jgi:hypothetical protein
VTHELFRAIGGLQMSVLVIIARFVGAQRRIALATTTVEKTT